MFHGKGTLFFANGSMYKGEWVEGTAVKVRLIICLSVIIKIFGIPQVKICVSIQMCYYSNISHYIICSRNICDKIFQKQFNLLTQITSRNFLNYSKSHIVIYQLSTKYYFSVCLINITHLMLFNNVMEF